MQSQPLLHDALYRLAAKFSVSDDASVRIHPLICHMIDVAAVAEAVWHDCLADRVRGNLAECFHLDQDDTQRWVAFLAGAHDVGKASPVFQAKGSKNRRSTPPWLVGTDLEFSLPAAANDPGHGTVTAAQLPAFLTGRFAISQQAADRLAVIAGGHHGIFPSAAKRASAHGIRLGEPTSGLINPWARAREYLASQLAAVVDVEGQPGALSNSASMVLAGFISVVDWIGSIDDEAFFPFAENGPDDLATYFATRRKRAREAIRLLHWDAWPQLAGPASFESLFPNIRPRPLQVTAQEVASEANGAELAIFEAPMGEGKTEAAFYIADYRNASGFRGSYFAMPTQATSNQLFGRLKGFLEHRYGPGDEVNLQLLHGHAALNAELKLLSTGAASLLPAGVNPGADDVDATVGAAEWFTHRKRGLLAPFGVGTIDQSLLAVLQVKHGFVRLFGLAGKTVIIDEVHAYDTYMTSLLERLLEWLAALGSPVVMLSATLPASRRKALVNAYLSGLGRPTLPALPAAAYPRITSTGPSGAEARTFATSSETRRATGLRWVPPDLDLARHLNEQLKAGGCAAVICNTVNRAQEIYAGLREFFDTVPMAERPELDLFHARFLFKDRQEREERCLRRFGKPEEEGGTTAERPFRAVLVATQVIEQSLDLDFDLLVSEIAPIDLLLQRSGRLQRHRRADRRGAGAPVLQILSPQLAEDGPPIFERASTFVYDEHILLRTWHSLQGRAAIAVPEDVEEMIEAVYSEAGEPPEAMPSNFARRWTDTWKAMEAKRLREQDEALQRRIPSPVGNAQLEDYTRDPREEDAADLHPALQALTRLSELNVQVVLLSPDSPLNRSLGRIPSMGECRELLLNTVSITAPDLARALLAEPTPASWKRSGLLGRLRTLQLDQFGRALVGTVALHYDPHLGLQIIRA